MSYLGGYRTGYRGTPSVVTGAWSSRTAALASPLRTSTAESSLKANPHAVSTLRSTPVAVATLKQS